MVNKKILLLHPVGQKFYLNSRRQIHQTFDHLGLGSLASFLEKNDIEVVVEYLKMSSKELDDLLVSIEKEQYSLVGIPVTQPAIHAVIDFAKQLKNKVPDVHITIGGHFPTAAHDLLLRDYQCFDSVIRGEGEFPLLTLARQILNKTFDFSQVPGLTYRQNGKVKSTSAPKRIENLDELPFLQRKNFDHLYMYSSRGCPFNCSYCSISHFYNNTGCRYRSAKHIVAEMSELYFNNGCRSFVFNDDNFIPPGSVGIKRVEEFCLEIKAQGLKDINISLMMVPPSITEEIITPLFEVGLRTFFTGIESASKASLKRLNKATTPEINARALDILLKYKELQIETGFIMFEPGSTLSDIEENINFMKKFSEDILFYPISKLEVFYGTPVYVNLQSEGKIYGSYLNPQYDFEDKKVEWLFEVSFGLMAKWGEYIFNKTEEYAFVDNEQKFIEAFLKRKQAVKFIIKLLEKLLEFIKEKSIIPNIKESILLLSLVIDTDFKNFLEDLDD